jgi:hypothetical protein
MQSRYNVSVCESGARKVHSSLVLKLIVLQRGIKYGQVSLLPPLLKHLHIICIEFTHQLGPILSILELKVSIADPGEYRDS